MVKNFKKIGVYLGSGALTALFRGVSLLPFRALYALADGLAWLAHDVVRYRRKVVADNLRLAFPEKSESERRNIARGYYRFLADYIFETAKMSGMRPSTMKERMRFEGFEALDRVFAEGRSVVVYLGHYGNWEWISSMPLHLPGDVVAGQIYHPLENEAFDRAFLRLRGRFGAVSIPMKQTLRQLLEWRREGRKSITGFISDQAPILESIQLWVEFFGQDTPVFTGAERMARKLGAAVYYFDVERPERGRYVCRMVEMAPDARAVPEGELTRDYYRRLEQTIRRRPELWLWSHRRWKRTRKMWEDWKKN